jgi:hypothetical protein
MRTVQLSRSALVGTVANYWNVPEFPQDIYIALETCPGFGEGAGGVGCGSVVNALQDLEGGGFFDMVRIDELILNLPEREAGFCASHPWVFAEEVNGLGIEWV